jgi:hypothetical protein
MVGHLDLPIGIELKKTVMYPILVLAGLGIGGILVPASIITTIVCPDDLIATVSALTLSIRVIGGGKTTPSQVV